MNRKQGQLLLKIKLKSTGATFKESYMGIWLVAGLSAFIGIAALVVQHAQNRPDETRSISH